MFVGSAQKLSKCRKLNLVVNNYTIECVEESKLLGVIIDETLSWKSHTESLMNKISKRIGILRRIRYFVSNAALFKIFNTMIFPHFTYCCTIWGNPRNADHVHNLVCYRKELQGSFLTSEIFKHHPMLCLHNSTGCLYPITLCTEMYFNV
jgi:hypothetical protein